MKNCGVGGVDFVKSALCEL